MSARQMVAAALLVGAALGPVAAQTSSNVSGEKDPKAKTYYGFDLNSYPGDEVITALAKKFDYAGFWLNAPPGATTNQWAGRRKAVEDAGLGFLVLFNGRLDAELKNADAAKLGRRDAKAAIEAAEREGFDGGTVIFLDIEEGGRMLPEQKAYIYAWVDAVNAGRFRAGVYCSGIAAAEGNGVTVVTANDLRENAAGRTIVYWVANDGCPPAPGCTLTKKALPPSESGVAFAEVWQFAQSPRRPELTEQCKASYAANQNCYVEGSEAAAKLGVDLNTSRKADPSHGRRENGK